jgi:uncharacterized membrane protein YphA (DoxX/SURF4 family)
MSFPRGRAGCGLLLLRVTLAALVMMITCHELFSSHAGLLSFVTAALALFIAIGLFTPVSSSMVGVLMVILHFLFHDVTALTLGTIVSLLISLSLTGAGAYSLDAIMFGRRRITIA